MKDLLVFCYPTFGMSLHTNSDDRYIVVAPDEIIKILSRRKWDIDVVNLCPFKTEKPLLRSRMKFKSYDEVNVNDYKIIWHMFRDPTQPEVMKFYDNIQVDGKVIINNIKYLVNFYKNRYLDVLYKHNIGPKVFSDIKEKDIKWKEQSWGLRVSDDNKLACLYNYNNNRGDYPDREKNRFVITEYLDSSVDNERSIFRVGYSVGKITSGFLYTADKVQHAIKSGTCKLKTPHTIHEKYHKKIVDVMNELGVDVAHVEGCYVNDEIKIFDINPYPTSNGETLGQISEDICNFLEEKRI